MGKILFDATVLVDGADMVEERRGIYFVALNLLKEFCKQKPGQIELYASTFKIVGLEKVEEELKLPVKTYRDVSAYSRVMYRAVTFFRKKRMANYDGLFFKNLYAVCIMFLTFCDAVVSFFADLFYQTPSGMVFFSPRTASPWFIRRKNGAKTFVVLHDLIPYLSQKKSLERYWGWFGHLIRNLGKDDFYFAISESTKKDFCGFSKKIKPERVIVSYWAADGGFRPCSDLNTLKELQIKYNLPLDKKYAFALGLSEPRKNTARVIRSFLSFVNKNHVQDMVLVVGGGKKIDIENRSQYVLPVGYIDDGDLPYFYAFAEWFVFTSQYEGFGLPLLEAMQCGCPVIAGNNSSMPEVVGDAGQLIVWNDDGQHVEAFEKFYFDEKFRLDCIRKGFERALKFSWEETVKTMIAVVES